MTGQTQEPRGLAKLLFGWTFQRGGGTIALITLALIGLSFVAAEVARPRNGLGLPFEESPGFYAEVGAGAVIGLMLVAAALKWALLQPAPYPPEAIDQEGRDDDHA